jgi:hypothetical protein
MSLYLLIPILAGVALFGWVAGMWTHKRAEHWCAVCGSQLTCGWCQRAGRELLVEEDVLPGALTEANDESEPIEAQP